MWPSERADAPVRPEQYSPLTLAYVGDAAYELYVRERLIASGNAPVGTLHRLATHFVSAKAQSEMMDAIEPALTPDESDAYRRGRNAKVGSTPKNTDVATYHRATGFETLMGYLYLKGDASRFRALLDAAAAPPVGENKPHSESVRGRETRPGKDFK